MTASRERILVVVLVSALSILSLSQFYPRQVNAGITWTGPSAVQQFPGSNKQNLSVLQAKDGSTWLAWADDRYTNASAIPPYDAFNILYATQPSGGAWGTALNVTSSGQSFYPSLAQLLNGTIMVFWSSNPSGTSCSPACNLYYASYITRTQTWSAFHRLTTGLFNDSYTSATVGPDGTLWLFWTRIIATCVGSSCTVTRQIFYRTLTGNSWTPETQLNIDTNWNYATTETFGRDGVLRIVYSKGASGVNSQLYARTYSGGTWSAETHIVSSPNADVISTLIQDRNGTFWVFYEENVPLSSILSQQVIFYTNSTNNGQTWSAPFQFTHDSTSIPIDDENPFVIQAGDKSIYVYYISDIPTGSNFDIYAVKSSSISPVHNVAVSALKSSAAWLYIGGSKLLGQSAVVTFNVTVLNLGDSSESTTVQLSAFNTTTYQLGSKTMTVASGTSLIFTFSWNTTGVNPGTYSLKAVASIPVEPLGNQGDNTLQANRILLLVPWGGASGAGGGGGHTQYR